ncbi:MAG: extracellular solute-binding protein [Clostridiales bacterium]|nr:extracellular solute-binding protein [Clostridiales bacterium]
MKKSIRKLLAVTLAACMVLPLAGCRKKTKKTEETEKTKTTTQSDDKSEDPTEGTDSGKNTSKTLQANPIRTIKAEDPFFSSEKTELKLEPVPDVVFATKEFTEPSLAGDRILVNVSGTLKDGSVVENLLEKNYSCTDGYTFNSLHLFDLNGQNLATIPLEQNCEFRSAFAMGKDEILVTVGKFDDFACLSTPMFFVISPSGEVLRELKFDIKDAGYNTQAYPMENGNIFVATDGNLYLFDSEGKLIKKNEEKSLGTFMNCSDGKWYVSRIALPSTNIAAYQEVDISTGELKKTYKIDGNYAADLAQNTNCLIFGETSVEQYSIEQGKAVPVLSATSADINCKYLKNGRILSDDSLLMIEADPDKDNDRFGTDCYCYFANTMSVVTLTRADKNPHAGKELLKLALCSNSDPYLLDIIKEYNADPQNHAYIETNTLYDGDISYMLDDERVKIVGHAADIVAEDLRAGEGPDMIWGFSEISDLDTERLLLDLKPYLTADTSINEEDYFYNIFSAFERDGKLFTMPLTYSLRSMAINSTISGAKEKWTFDDLKKMEREVYPPNRIFAEYSCSEILSLYMSASNPDFIDNEKCEVHFNSDNFKALLETVKKYSVPDLEMNGGFTMSSDGYLLAPEDLFMQDQMVSIYARYASLEEYCIFRGMNNGDKAIFTGYPSFEGKSMTALGVASVSITACASDPDLAFEFIRYCLKAETQQYLCSGMCSFPVSRSAFDAICQAQIEPNAEIRRKIEEEPGDYYLPCTISETERDELAAIISSVDNSFQFDSDIILLVLTGADGYFRGLESLDSAVKAIQKDATNTLKNRGH